MRCRFVPSPRGAYLTIRAIFTLACFGSASAIGQVGIDEVVVETIADGLSQPADLAVRPGGSRSGPNLLCAESGARRVVGLSTDESSADDASRQLATVIEGFDGEDNAGPSCLVFRSRNRLLVGQSGSESLPATVCEYDIDDERLPMASSDRRVVLSYAGDEPAPLASIARDGDVLLVATGDHQWLLKATLRGEPPKKLGQFLRTRDESQVGSPRAVAFSEKGYLVVGEAGADDRAADSAVVFYHPVDMTAGPLLVLTPQLDDIVALAYSPTSANLYAADFAAERPERGGIYRIDATIDADTGKQGCQAVLVAQIAHPTALAFTADGTLYATTRGSENVADGKLLKLTGDL